MPEPRPHGGLESSYRCMSSRGHTPRSKRSCPRAEMPNRDLASVAEARALAGRAKQAWLELAEFTQDEIDAVVHVMAASAAAQAGDFARLAVDETGYGVVEDKIQKN